MAAFNVTRVAFARERITVTSGAAIGLTANTFNDVANQNPFPSGTTSKGAINRKANAARIVADSGSGDYHFSCTGTAATSGTTASDVGVIASAKDVIMLESYDSIVKFSARALSTNAILEVEYYR